MKYKHGDIVDTTKHGFLTVQFDFTIRPVFEGHRAPGLVGRTLYWLTDLSGQDLFIWDNDLSEILTAEEKFKPDSEYLYEG